MNPAAAQPVCATESTGEARARLGSVALDQWRGLALLLVLVSHGFYFTGRVYGLGRVGVNLFFFISGILVFRSLSRTRARTAGDRARSFWWRRLRRLYPALLAYGVTMLGGTWWLQRLPGLPEHSDLTSYLYSLPWAVGYGINYTAETAPMSLGHLWSLACEMQFYALAPILYWLGGNTPTRRKLVFGTLLAILMVAGMAQPFIGKWKYHFEFAVWPMMLGFVCEYLREWFERIPDRLVTLGLRSCVGLGLAVFVLALFGVEMKLVVILTGTLMLIPCLLAYVAGRPIPGVSGQAMGWIGERTYSIYMWQQPLTLCQFLPTFLHPLGALASIGIGAAWFHLFERPFLSPGRRQIVSQPAVRT